MLNTVDSNSNERLYCATEWIVSHEGLPEDTTNRPDVFKLSLSWSNDISLQPSNVSLYLKKSSAVPRKLPVFTIENGKYKQTGLTSLKVSFLM